MQRRGIMAGVGLMVCVGLIATLWAGTPRPPAGSASGDEGGIDLARTSEARTTAVLGAVVERPAEPEAGALPLAAADAPIIAAPATFEGPRAVARPARPVGPPAHAGGEGGTWALVVGINDYPGDAADLRFAVNDADDVDSALSQFGVGTDRRLVLRDGQATSEAIRAGLAWLVERAGKDSLAVVSFAGHARERQGDRQAFVAADGVELADRELAGRLRGLRSGKVWLNFGTCYAGGFDELLAPGRLLTGAAPAGQLAYESTAIGRSYLGEYMVRRNLLAAGADGDVGRAFVTGRDAIARDYPNRLPVAITGPGPVDINLRSAATPPAAASTQSAAASQPASPGGTSGGNGSSPPPAQPAPSNPPPAEEPPTRRDGCADLTLGAVNCS